MNYQVHPLADRFPMMSGERFQKLVESIRKLGLVEAIVIQDGTTIIDGRNRLRACAEANVTPHFIEYAMLVEPLRKHGLAMDVKEYIWVKNVERRDLTDDQRAALVMGWAEYEREQAKNRVEVARHRLAVANSPQPNSAAREALATRADVTVHKVRQAQAVKQHDEQHGTELLATVEKGEMELKLAAKKAGFTKDAKAKKKGSVLRRFANPWKFEQQIKQVEAFIRSKLAAAPKNHRRRLEAQILSIARNLCKEEPHGEIQAEGS